MKMKLLKWVHHKFRHSGVEPLKDLSIGNLCICLSDKPSVDDHDSYMKSCFSSSYRCTSLEQPTRDQELSFSESEAKREEETSAIFSELFHGFLTIGTLGSEPSINEPQTPTFATNLENLTEQKTEVTENDLKLISYELEKFLEAETKEEGVHASSARNSHASTITLSGKQMEESEDEEYGTTMVCPLKGYLFGSSNELPETKIEAKKEKISLQELFDRTKMAAEICKEKSESEEIEAKNKHKSAMQFMKKMIKKLHASSNSCAPSAGGDATDPVFLEKKLGEASGSVSTKKKSYKVLRMFHRRIHPESSIGARKFVKSDKYMDKNNPTAGGGCNENMILKDGGNRRFPEGEMVKEGTRRKGEQWIKTDADYLVLEL